MPDSASFPKSTAVLARSGSPHIMACISLVLDFISRFTDCKLSRLYKFARSQACPTSCPACQLVGASLSEAHMMRYMGNLSVCLSVCQSDDVCLSVRSHSVYTRVLIQRYRMRKTSVQSFFHLYVYVYVSLRVCVGVRRVEVHGLYLRTRINQSQYRSL